MGLFSFLRGRTAAGAGSADSGAEPLDYNGFRIRPAPRREGSSWLVAGVISKAYPDGVKEHAFVRADTFTSLEDARALSLEKGKRIVDERGERLFDRG